MDDGLFADGYRSPARTGNLWFDKRTRAFDRRRTMASDMFTMAYFTLSLS